MSRTYRALGKLICRPELIENRSTWHGAACRWQSSVVKVAIVGSGPSGCYTAKYLQSALQHKEVEGKIDVLERLPTPFGLVRSGVAPDHPEVKNVQNDFTALFEHEDSTISFLGNVTVGKDISLQELRELYDVVVLAYGCESDRKLNIPGEDTLTGVLSAREFVAWYNGHPDYVHIGDLVADALGDDPGTANVVVVGQGNVALDCARVLAKGARGLADTDIASYVFPVLKHGVKSTSIVGRRGHIQGAFTIKELRELTKLEAEGHETSFIVKKDELDMGSTPASEKELNAKGARPKVRIDKLLREAAANPLETRNAKEVHLRFLLNPARFEANETDSTKLGAVICERTKLEGEPGSQVAVGTGEFETIPAQLALISIGYKGVALPGIIESGLFDSQRGVVVNTHGKVDDSKDGLGGLYVSGWLKRGPSGIIGTNIADAKDTVASITKDLEGQTIKSHDTSLHYLLKERGVKVVDWSAYERIDATETDEARKRSREQPREKLTSIDEMLRAASL